MMKSRIAGKLAIGTIAVFLAGGCENATSTGPDPEGSVGPEAGLTNEIRVTSFTTGASLDPDGYVVTVDDISNQSIETNGTVTFAGLAPGQYQVRLSGLATNCFIARDNPRTVEVVAGQRSVVTFDILCSSGEGKIAFVRRHVDGRQAIFVLDVGGGGAVRISDPPGGDEDYDPAWSPDGTRIAFTRGKPGYGEREVWVMNADGANPRQLTDDAAQDFAPTWSPDGTRIAFSTNRAGAYEIFAIDADGSNPVNLTNDRHQGDLFPDWSPDGTGIAFTRCCPLSIHVAPLDGGSTVRLSDPGEDGDFGADWSPDGTRIAFARGDVFGWTPHDIWVMDADGSNPRNLTQSSADDSAADWSPDGARIAFASDRGGNSDIYVMDADGGNMTAITDYAGHDWDPVWSPQ